MKKPIDQELFIFMPGYTADTRLLDIDVVDELRAAKQLLDGNFQLDFSFAPGVMTAKTVAGAIRERSEGRGLEDPNAPFENAQAKARIVGPVVLRTRAAGVTIMPNSVGVWKDLSD